MKKKTQVHSKICIICGENKLIKEYYKHGGMIDGHLGKCKKCCKSQSSELYNNKMNDPEFVKSERVRNAKRRAKDKRKTYLKTKKYRADYPEKYMAHQKVQRRVVKNKYYHKHHWSYREEYQTDIIELTIRNHVYIHKRMIYDQKNMIYKTLDGKLLDTKEVHLKYINKIISERDGKSS